MNRIERSPVVGQCLPDWHGQVALVDPAAPVASGDTVRVTVDYADSRTASVMKVLRVDSQDRWWITCSDGALQLGKFIVPRRVEKVVGREPSPIDLDHVPVLQPSAHTLAVGRRCLEELRADQAANGTRLGVPFPAQELTRPRMFGRVPETAHSTLPDSNPPIPGYPTALSLSAVNGTTKVSWSLPEIFPPRSVVRVLESTSNYPASAASVAWEGVGTAVSLQRIDATTRYYWVAAFCGSAFSEYTPSTYGLSTAPSQPVAPNSMTISRVAAFNYSSVTSAVSSGTLATAVVPPGCDVLGGNSSSYGYGWSVASGYPATVINPTSATPSFRVTSRAFADRYYLEATAKCTVSDTTNSVTAYGTIVWVYDDGN